MTPEAEAFLARVRDAELPAADVEQRVLAAVQAAVAPPAALYGPQPTAAGGAKVALNAKASLKLVLWIAGFAVTSVAVQPAKNESRAVGSRNTGFVAENVRRAESPKVSAAPPEIAAADDMTSLPPVDGALLSTEPVRPSRSRSRQTGSAGLQAELALLAQVYAALRRGDGDDALRRLDAHRTADRQLAVERRAARVLALCAAGRVVEARSAAEEFIRRHPSSPQRSAIDRACTGTQHD